jgi:hypothetical protein
MNAKETKKRREHVRKAIAHFDLYVSEYDEQTNYEDYSDVTIVKDMVYGLGLALWGEAEHQGASGYERTVARVIDILERTK